MVNPTYSTKTDFNIEHGIILNEYMMVGYEVGDPRAMIAIMRKRSMKTMAKIHFDYSGDMKAEGSEVDYETKRLHPKKIIGYGSQLCLCRTV